MRVAIKSEIVESLFALAENKAFRTGAREIIYETLIANPSFQSPEFKKLLKKLKNAFNAYQKDPADLLSKRFIRARHKMEAYCEQPEIFTWYVYAYKHNILPLDQKIVLLLEKTQAKAPEEPEFSLSSLFSFHFLGKALVVYLASVGQALALASPKTNTAQGPNSINTGIAAKSDKALSRKTTKPPSQSHPNAPQQAIPTKTPELPEISREQLRSYSDFCLESELNTLLPNPSAKGAENPYDWGLQLDRAVTQKLHLSEGSTSFSDAYLLEEAQAGSALAMSELAIRYIDQAKIAKDVPTRNLLLARAVLLTEEACGRSPKSGFLQYNAAVIYTNVGPIVENNLLHNMRHAYQAAKWAESTELNMLSTSERGFILSLSDPQYAASYSSWTGGLLSPAKKTSSQKFSAHSISQHELTEKAFKGNAWASHQLSLRQIKLNYQLAYSIQALLQDPKNSEYSQRVLELLLIKKEKLLAPFAKLTEGDFKDFNPLEYYIRKREIDECEKMLVLMGPRADLTGFRRLPSIENLRKMGIQIPPGPKSAFSAANHVILKEIDFHANFAAAGDYRHTLALIQILDDPKLTPCLLRQARNQALDAHANGVIDKVAHKIPVDVFAPSEEELRKKALAQKREQNKRKKEKREKLALKKREKIQKKYSEALKPFLKNFPLRVFEELGLRLSPEQNGERYDRNPAADATLDIDALAIRAKTDPYYSLELSKKYVSTGMVMTKLGPLEIRDYDVAKLFIYQALLLAKTPEEKKMGRRALREFGMPQELRNKLSDLKNQYIEISKGRTSLPVEKIISEIEKQLQKPKEISIKIFELATRRLNELAEEYTVSIPCSENKKEIDVLIQLDFLKEFISQNYFKNINKEYSKRVFGGFSEAAKKAAEWREQELLEQKKAAEQAEKEKREKCNQQHQEKLASEEKQRKIFFIIKIILEAIPTAMMGLFLYDYLMEGLRVNRQVPNAAPQPNSAASEEKLKKEKARTEKKEAKRKEAKKRAEDARLKKEAEEQLALLVAQEQAKLAQEELQKRTEIEKFKSNCHWLANFSYYEAEELRKLSHSSFLHSEKQDEKMEALKREKSKVQEDSSLSPVEQTEISLKIDKKIDLHQRIKEAKLSISDLCDDIIRRHEELAALQWQPCDAIKLEACINELKKSLSIFDPEHPHILELNRCNKQLLQLSRETEHSPHKNPSRFFKQRPITPTRPDSETSSSEKDDDEFQGNPDNDNNAPPPQLLTRKKQENISPPLQTRTDVDAAAAAAAAANKRATRKERNKIIRAQKNKTEVFYETLQKQVEALSSLVKDKPETEIHRKIQILALHYRFIRLELLLFRRYAERNQFSPEDLFDDEAFGRFSDELCNLLMHNYFEVKPAPLLTCLRDIYCSPEIPWEEVLKAVEKTALYKSIRPSQEFIEERETISLDRTLENLLNDYKKALSDLAIFQNMCIKLGAEKASKDSNLIDACRMTLMIIGEISQRLRKLCPKERDLRWTWLNFLHKCRIFVRNDEKHLFNLKALPQTQASASHFELEAVSPSDILKLVEVGSEQSVKPKTEDLFETFRRSLKDLMEEDNKPRNREMTSTRFGR